MTFKHYRAESRRDYGVEVAESVGMTGEGLRLGAILRIADALEKIAQPYARMLGENERMRREIDDGSAQREHLRRRLNAQKAATTRAAKRATKQ